MKRMTAQLGVKYVMTRWCLEVGRSRLHGLEQLALCFMLHVRLIVLKKNQPSTAHYQTLA